MVGSGGCAGCVDAVMQSAGVSVVSFPDILVVAMLCPRFHFP